MNVPARIYATEKLLLNEMDEGVFDQVTNVATLPGILKYAYCMPDGHWGYGFPIGGVAAAAGKLTCESDRRVAVAVWFCPGTVDNLRQNHKISLVVWDAAADIGYQLLGEVEKVEELSVLDGYVPGEEEKPSLPQVERQLLVRLEKIIDFSHNLCLDFAPIQSLQNQDDAPHSDVED
jgi:hypothetical protein